MPEYMLLLYGSESADEAERAQRWAEMPLWDQLNASLRDAGVLVAHAPLHSVESATTVRVGATSAGVNRPGHAWKLAAIVRYAGL